MKNFQTYLTIFLIVGLTACSSTQKTEGQGMVSVVAQNAVRIAGAEAIAQLDIADEVSNKASTVNVTGFADSFSSGFVLNLIRDAVEDQGGRLVRPEEADITIDVAVNAAGNDLAGNSFIIGGSTRSEGSLNLTVTIRNTASGSRISRQQIEGYAKYQQGRFLGITGSGAYFVLKNDKWELVDDPAYY